MDSFSWYSPHPSSVEKWLRNKIILITFNCLCHLMPRERKNDLFFFSCWWFQGNLRNFLFSENTRKDSSKDRNYIVMSLNARQKLLMRFEKHFPLSGIWWDFRYASNYNLKMFKDNRTWLKHLQKLQGFIFMNLWVTTWRNAGKRRFSNWKKSLLEVEICKFKITYKRRWRRKIKQFVFSASINYLRNQKIFS